NRELFALGMADIGAAFTGGYPVTGGFSRSVVNYSAGVRTPLGSVITALLVAISVLFLTPLFFYIPKAVLAAIIVVAVATLVDLKTPIRLWRFSRSDAIALVITFAAVLLAGIETGIIIGIVATGILYMWRASRPHIAEVGRIPGTEHFRNVERFEVETLPGVLALRVDESLTFANAPCLESWLLGAIADRPELHCVLLVASGINDVDATGIEVLESIREELKSSEVELYLSDVKGPVIDRLRNFGMDEVSLNDHIILSADLAFKLFDQGKVQREPATAIDLPSSSSVTLPDLATPTTR
ncbi:MAG: SulP family inorganic anion transporter, partial [Pirellulaceae bacterium]